MSDINDNSPMFPQETYAIELSESVPVGTPVTNLFATDDDFGSNGQVLYTIASQSSSITETIYSSKHKELV